MDRDKEKKHRKKSGPVKEITGGMIAKSIKQFADQQEEASARLFKLDLASGNPYAARNQLTRNEAYIEALKALATKAEAKLKRPGRPPQYSDDDVSAVREFILHSKVQKTISSFQRFEKWYKKNRKGALPFQTTTFYKIKKIIQKP